MISPWDYAYRMKHKPEYNEILNKALENCKNNREKELLFFDFYYKYSYTMADFLTNNNLDNFPILSKETEKMRQFNNIDVPITILYGSEEKKYTSSIDFLHENINKNCRIDIIESANHSFNGCEKELSKKILEIRR